MELNVLIVDDEPIVCKGLRETVPWEEWGVRIVGEAHDGEEALEMLARHDVDLVLSDIRMPGMDGLELSRAVSERFPDKRIVILSGYDEFEYARQAMRLGVKDYLLKPVNLDELGFVIRNIRHELADKRAKAWREAAGQLLAALAVGERAAAFHADLAIVPGLSYRLLAAAIDMDGAANAAPAAGEAEHAAGIKPWIDKAEHLLNAGGNLAAAAPIGPNRLLALCGMDGRGDGMAAIRRMAETIREQSGFRMWCCLSAPFQNLDDLAERYLETVKGLGAFPVMGGPVYETSEIPEPEWVDPAEEAERFRPLVEKGCDRDTLRRQADELFDRFAVRRYGLDDVAAALRQLEDRLFAGLPAWQEMHVSEAWDAGWHGSYDRLKERFIRELEPYVIREGGGACVEQRMLVDKALRYMNDHYNKDLRAAKVAGWINVSPNYFSQLLKKVTGKHFNDLLHDIRIDKAKRLLAETDLRIFQVGRLVGYKEYKYFVHTFKRLTSVSPSRYRMMAYQSKRKHRTEAEREQAEPSEMREG